MASTTPVTPENNEREDAPRGVMPTGAESQQQQGAPHVRASGIDCDRDTFRIYVVRPPFRSGRSWPQSEQETLLEDRGPEYALVRRQNDEFEECCRRLDLQSISNRLLILKDFIEWGIELAGHGVRATQTLLNDMTEEQRYLYFDADQAWLEAEDEKRRQEERDAPARRRAEDRERMERELDHFLRGNYPVKRFLGLA